jgi:cell division protein FtsB
MQSFQKKNKKKLFQSKIFFIFILLFLFLFIKAIISFYTKTSESKIRRDQTENEFLELETRKYDLENRIERLESSVGIEEQLREKFDLIKEGEKIILISDPQKATSSD